MNSSLQSNSTFPSHLCGAWLSQSHLKTRLDDNQDTEHDSCPKPRNIHRLRQDTMSDPRAASNDGDNDSGDSMDAAVAKTAGFVVFSGIAMSILKTLNPFNKDRNATPLPQQPVAESTQSSLTQPIRDSPPPPPPEPIITEVFNNSLYSLTHSYPISEKSFLPLIFFNDFGWGTLIYAYLCDFVILFNLCGVFIVESK